MRLWDGTGQPNFRLKDLQNFFGMSLQTLAIVAKEFFVSVLL